MANPMENYPKSTVPLIATLPPFPKLPDFPDLWTGMLGN